MAQGFRNRLVNALLGNKRPDIDSVDLEPSLVGVDTSNPYFAENMGTDEITPQVKMSTQTSPRQGGILPDMARGYQENYNNGFSINNLGQNKGWAQRLGEGLGSVGRFIDSPLGRGLIAAGLNSALGYDESFKEGLTAAVGRQNAQTADKVYRQQLKQMGYSDEDLANIRGNITSDIYKNLSQNVYRFRNLDQNTYVKMKNAYDRQLQSGILTPEEYRANVEALNNQYVNSQIQTMGAGNVQESNQSKLAENKINVDARKLEQNDRRLNILQQRVNQGAASAAELSEYRALKKEQMELENELYRKELGKGGGGNTGGTVRPVGQTKSGVKYKVVG